MKTLQNLVYAMCLMTVVSVLTTSCSKESEFVENVENIPQTEERIPRYATMQLDGGVVGFDNATRTSDGWEEGDKIYLQFTVGSERVDGAAIYNATTEEWDVQYYGTLTTGAETACEAYYFENASEASHVEIALNEHTAIYCDKAATYLFENDVLKVSADLTPMTGRIRMAGDVSQEFRFSGIRHYCTYSITDNQFVSTEKNHVSSADDNGYSAYYYGFFPDEAKKEIFFDDIEHGVTYTRTLGEQALAVGRSGYLNIPSIDNRSGWATLQFKDFTVSNVTFRMIRVVDNSTYNVPSFWIAETEVTQELWKAVMGSSNNPSSFTGEANLPVETVSWDDCQTFITKLNSKTGLKFRLPSGNEWMCASSGACLSKGYDYSGSDDYNAVAWCSNNSYGNYRTHPVKQKSPNEIGTYDMSGNVGEWVTDVYRYSNGSIDHYFYGGTYRVEYSHTRYNYSTHANGSASTIGFRLAL